MLLGKTLATDTAVVEVFTGMRSQVFVEGAFLREAFPTLFAYKWLFSGMCSDVTFKCVVQGKEFATFFAFKCFFTGMCSHMGP